MTTIKEFEKWATECGFDISKWKNGVYKTSTTTLIFSMWQEKQREIDALKAEVAHLRSYPEAFRREESRADKAEREIDALKEENKHLSENLSCISDEANNLEEENGHLEEELVKLKAEVERLRKDAERIELLCRPGIELWLDCEPEPRDDSPFVVSQMSGSRNDREWVELGRGKSVREAIDAAMKETK